MAFRLVISTLILGVIPGYGFATAFQSNENPPVPTIADSSSDSGGDSNLPASQITPELAVPPSIPRRPPIGWRAEWITDPDSGLATSQVDATVPLLGPFGKPPPLIKIGFGYTNLFGADSFGLPQDLFEYSIGMTWVRPINDRWTLLTITGATMATDNENRSSDAWQFRGGLLALWKYGPNWTWTLGAIATGREDLPVIPAVGAVWNPNPSVRFDLTFPQPKVNYLLRDHGANQHWLFAGFGINGTTWAYQRGSDVDDRLTYRDLRVMVGWERRPTATARLPFPVGRTIRAEVGLAFAREFEYFNDTFQQPLDSSFLMGLTTRF